MRRRLSVAAIAALAFSLLPVFGPSALLPVAGAVACNQAVLQAALDSAQPGAVIEIEGTCQASLRLPPFQIVLQGDPGDATPVDGFTGSTTDVSILSGEDVATTTIQSLVFSNGADVDGSGGAIELTGTSTPRILDNQFTDNTATIFGGAVSIENPEPMPGITTIITGNVFDGNEAGAGGGALYLAMPGSRVLLDGNAFTDNRESGGTNSGGGASVDAADVIVTDNEFTGNRSESNGGGLAAFAVELTMHGNDFVGNSALVAGGGAAVQYSRHAVLEDNEFRGNELTGTAQSLFFGRVGAGLAVSMGASNNNVLAAPPGADDYSLVQIGNLFDANIVRDPGGQGPTGGGGEWIAAITGLSTTSHGGPHAGVFSRNDRFVNNVVEGGSTEGGGLGFLFVSGGCCIELDAEPMAPQGQKNLFYGENLVAAGNTLAVRDIDEGVPGEGEGGGIYTGVIGEPTDRSSILHLTNATVAGNQVMGVAGEGIGIAGDAEDELYLTNTIVWGNSPILTDDIAGFTITEVVSSDVCDVNTPGAPFPGPGNICADPLLVDPDPGVADVHQTTESPTVDQGSNALVPSDLTDDYEGDARIIGPAVDMGADELLDADVSISKTDSPDPVRPGDRLTYTITVRNLGPGTADPVLVSDTLPPGVVLESIANSVDGPCGESGGDIFCQQGAIPPGEEQTVTIVVITTEEGVITNTASVSTDRTFDPDMSNNTDQESTLVAEPIQPVRHADLSVSKTDSPDPVQAGEELTYTITVTNQGPDPAVGVMLTDSLPAGLTVLRSSCGGLTCDLGTLASGASTVVTIVVVPTEPGVIENTVFVGSSTSDPDTSNNSDIEPTLVAFAGGGLEICPGPFWFFAEGTTRDGFDEYLLVFNTAPTATDITITYTVDGGPNVVRSYSLAGETRLTIPVFEPGNLGRGLDHGTEIEATTAILVERSMYINANVAGIPVNGDHNAIADADPKTEWLFAEGTTLTDFQTYFTVANPGDQDTVVTATYGVEGGGVVTRTKALPARSRITIDANSTAEGVGPGVVGFSTRLTATEPVVAERPVYFDHAFPFAEGDVGVNGASVAFGSTAAQSWYMAEGNVLPDFAQYLTIGNPGAADAPVSITYNLEGQAPIQKSITVPAGSRETVEVFNAGDAGGVGRNVSDPVSRGLGVVVTTTSADGIVVERPMYFGRSFDPAIVDIYDGHTTGAFPGFENVWYFAEGTGLPTFRTFLTLSNPQSVDANVTVTYYPDDGSGAVTKSFVVPAQQRKTIQTYDPAEPAAYAAGKTGFAMKIESDLPVLAERPEYEDHAFPDIGTVNGGSVSIGLPDACGRTFN